MQVSAPSSELVVGALIAHKYRIESLLGRGGMGAVYLATNEDLGRHVAIKVLLPQFAKDETLLKRFRQEARTAAAIGHPGIVDVLDLGTTEDGSPFIVMEALEGETLGARIVRERRLPVAAALHVVALALDALAAAHEKGVLHRDLKPDNLFLVARPVPGAKLLDFGISKLAGTDDIELTHTGTVLGTVLFMAPEQARGARNAGPASDIYSIGAILFHALTGRPPFTGLTYNEVLEKVFTQQAPSVTAFRGDIPPELALLIDRMLAKDPASRPASARDASATLLAIAARLDTFIPAADAIGETLAPVPTSAALHTTATPSSGTPIAAMRTLESGPTADTRQGPVAPTVPVPPARTSDPAIGATAIAPTDDTRPAAGADPRFAVANAETRPAPATPTRPAATNAAPARAGTRIMWLVGGGVVLAGGIAIAALALRHGDDSRAAIASDAGTVHERAQPADAAPAPIAIDAPATITLRLRAPVAVRWSGDGVRCADGLRCDVTAPAGSHSFVTATAAGFKAADVAIAFDVEHVVDIQLDRLPRAPRDAGVAQPVVPIDARGQMDIDHVYPVKP